MSNDLLKSMTAFVRHQGHGDWGSATWELRSVNHRYLEQVIRLPEDVRELELDVRRLTRDYLQRGKVECQLRFQRGAALNKDLMLNQSLVESLKMTSQQVTSLMDDVNPLRMVDILNWPGVVLMQDIDISEIKPVLVTLYEEALAKFVSVREREGEALKDVILSRLQTMQDIIARLVQQQPEILQAQREQWQQRLQELQAEYDEQRLEQEMLILAQKIDVAEELDRLQTHVNEVTRIIEKGGVIGRRLDFFMQELNREANTLGSKSINADMTQAAVELKVLIEQMREQVQNIE